MSASLATIQEYNLAIRFLKRDEIIRVRGSLLCECGYVNGTEASTHSLFRGRELISEFFVRER